MKNKLQLLGITVISFAIIGCASTTIYPEGGNKSSLVTTSSSESIAEKTALQKAQEHCIKQGKELVVLHHQTTYQGVDKNHKAMIGLANAIITNSGVNPTNSSNDYRVDLSFTCQ